VLSLSPGDTPIERGEHVMNQASTNNRQLSRKDDLITWSADVPNSADRYVAFFNAQGDGIPYDSKKALPHEIPTKNRVSVTLAELGITGKAKVRDVWKRQEVGVVSGEFSQEIRVHGAGLFRLSPTR
jgi:alpha-galactosidase